ncbi:uncharacterized protein LOC113505529 [Trichoplusia ni]|uniref:Uncharacterized protein LOC113505529 n=1 Tax=Trichoplusia ni TaxID=7111 RepID=A0A7E5WUY2_TRINI|nr:uncharacterized protein LOC113505529 [Trichoplusia ni]
MYSIINSNFNRTYNPNSRQNALSDIKKLLTSRDTAAQNKACGYLIEVISRYNKNSNEGARMVEYLLENDITVFLCEATSNLDFTLFRSILTCLRLLWRSRQFFACEHAAHAMTGVLRALAHYASSGSKQPVDVCLHFLCDLLNSVAMNKTTPPLSHQSAYSTVQLLACLSALSTRISTNPNTILSSALVIHSLISYQPDNLTINTNTANALLEVLKKWFGLLMGTLNHYMLVGDNTDSGMFYAVICQLGLDVFGLIKLVGRDQKADFVQTILSDDHEINGLRQSLAQMKEAVSLVVAELVGFTKEHQTQIPTEEYNQFLRLLLSYFYDHPNAENVTDFCDMLFSKGYLMMLPQVQINRNDVSVRKMSTLVLGELLKVLADKYLMVNDVHTATCAKDIHMGLIELQYGIERPHRIGSQLQKSQPYSLLIYIYFYCQSSENPEEATAQLLPYLVEHILKLPKSFRPPPYIIKALWLVFAMSSISNGSLQSLDERVYLEKATDRLVTMLHPQPSVYYTHNPAILLWAFTSQRISHFVQLAVLTQWLKSEDSLPTDLTTQPAVWELLLNILIQCTDKTVVGNGIEALHVCLEDGDDESRQDFAVLVWSMLPNVLSKVLIDPECQIDSNICHFLDLATELPPLQIDQIVCLKTAVLITAIFSKNLPEHCDEGIRHHYEYVCMKLGLYLLSMANQQNDNRVLLSYTNRVGFLQAVLSAADSADERVACAALQLLSYVIHYFTKSNYQPKSVLQIQTHLIIRALKRDSTSERGASLLQLVYMVLNTGASSPLALAYSVEERPTVSAQCNALRALMFRIQLMLCCRDSKNQSSAGWKTLSSIFKHAIVTKNDTKLIATLTSQPWTHTLIHFQLTQGQTQEFLTFTQNWLTLLKITIKKYQEVKRIQLGKHSLVIKTMVMMKKNLDVNGEFKDVAEKLLVIVDEILEDSGIKRD